MDTACSSSLVATQLATAAILPGTASGALAGGVNLLLASETTSIAQKAGMLSADGRCKTLDAAADGYGRGEACGLILLAPFHSEQAFTSTSQLDDARVGWPTSSGWMGVITGAAVAQDGRSSSLTAPNGPAQQAVIRSALQSMTFDSSTHVPDQVVHIQMHGTGTSLGDPIEVGALAAVFAGPPSGGGASRGMGTHSDVQGVESGHQIDQIVLMASKSWVGHSEPASGVTSIAHAMASLGQALTLPMTHLRSLNPYVASPLASSMDRRMTVPRQQGPSHQQPNRSGAAGVSSFAFQGTNAHLLLQPPPAGQHQPLPSGLCGSSSGNQPTLIWSRKRAWVAPRSHPLLMSAHFSPASPGQVVMECWVSSVAALAYLQDHRVAGRVLMPGAAFFIAAAAAGQSLLLEGSRASSNSPAPAGMQADSSQLPAQLLTAATIQAPCVLPTHSTSAHPLVMTTTADKQTGQVAIYSIPGTGKSITHMHAHLSSSTGAFDTHSSKLHDLGSWTGNQVGTPMANPLTAKLVSLLIEQHGVQPHTESGVARLPAVGSIPRGSEESGQVNPAGLDGVLQLGAAANAPGGLHIPTALGGMRLPGQPADTAHPAGLHVAAEVHVGRERMVNYSMQQPTGSAACHISQLQARPMLQSTAAPLAAATAASTCSQATLGTYKVTWLADATAATHLDGYPLAPAGPTTHLPANAVGACARLLQEAQQLIIRVNNKSDGLTLTTVDALRMHGPELTQQLQQQQLTAAGLASLMRTLAMENLHLHFDTQDVSQQSKHCSRRCALTKTRPTQSQGLRSRTGVFGASTKASVHHLAVLEPHGEDQSAGTAAKYRHDGPDPSSGAAFQLMPCPRGALDNIKPVPVDISAAQQGCHVISMEAAGLNFRDVLNCLGAYPGDPGGCKTAD